MSDYQPSHIDERLRCWRDLFIVLIISSHLSCCHALTDFAICAHPQGKCHWNIPKHKIHILFASKSRLPSYTINDSEKELESIHSWKSTSPTAKEAEIVYRAPSALDENAFVEVKKRIHGWHTLGIVGGPTKSIYHGVFQKDEVTGLVDPYALGPSEYIRTMASVALCLSGIDANGYETNIGGDSTPGNLFDGQDSSDDSNDALSSQSTRRISSTPPLRFLHMGYGSGSLMRFLRRAIPHSQHVAIDLDPTVADAAMYLGLVDPASTYETLVVGDALEYHGLDSTQDMDETTRFQCVCIDVFDGANLMPAGFYAVPFLENLRDSLLETSGCSYVVHNFHVGTERLETQLEDAMESYRTVFGSTSAKEVENDEDTRMKSAQQGFSRYSLYRVDSLNTNNYGGNTILIATIANSSGNEFSTNDNSWMELAELAMERWEEKRFDLVSRIEQIRPF